MAPTPELPDAPAGAPRAGAAILRGGAANAIGFLARFGARFGFLWIAARLFGAELLGAYTLALAVVELGVMVGGVGSRWLIFQWIDERAAGAPPLGPVVDAACLVALAAGSVALLVTGASFVVPGEATATALRWLAPTILVQSLIELLLAATRWTQAVRWDVIGKSVIQPWAGLAAALAAWAAGWDAIGLPLSYLAASLVTLCYAAWGARRCLGAASRHRPQPARIAAMAARGAPTMMSEAADGMVARVDLWLVGVLLGEGAAGVYALAKQIAIVVRQVRQSFDGLLVPIVSRTLSHAGEAATGAAIASAVRLVLIVQLPVLIVFAASGAPLLDAFGPGYRGGLTALLLLAVAETIQGAFGVADLLFAYRRPRTGLAIALAGVAVAGVAAVPLIDALGIAGAAAALLIGYVARALLRRAVLLRGFGIATPLSAALPPLAIGAASIVLALVLSHWPVAALAAGLGSFALALFVWRRATGVSFVPHGFVDESP